MIENDRATEQLGDRWVSFQVFQQAVGRPPLNVRFAVKALGRVPRRKPGDQRFTQYDLAWADEVRAYLDSLGNPTAPRA
ncbi:MAG TPA: hypothetical protein VGP82_16365 [Ktedonobacterales bacterium]|nr:hypothetical protein [Ktedonobacterales bacterium]